MYGFWCLYDVNKNRLIKRRKEAIVAITGAYWPSQAAVTHENHEEYARRTLYAYMLCPGLLGIEYIDHAVAEYYGNSFGAALRDFVREGNVWCPPWIQRNYEVQNQTHADAGSEGRNGQEGTEPTGVPQGGTCAGVNDDEVQQEPVPIEVDTQESLQIPHLEHSTIKFDFQDGEPQHEDEQQEQRPETYESSYYWREENRTAEQLHSSKGASYHNDRRLPRDDEYLSGSVNLKSVDWSRHRQEVSPGSCAKFWHDVRQPSQDYYEDTTLSIESLDTYQALFVRLVLRHVQQLIDKVVIASPATPPVPPLRLLLLGTAGTGKTRAIQTLLQNCRRS